MVATASDAFAQLPAQTRVWIYQSNQPLHAELIPAIRQAAQTFARQWISHNNQLRAAADILFNQFVVLMVDESQAGASGCSIDKSVAFIKHLQAELGVDFFDRMTFTYLEGDQVHTANRELFTSRYQEGIITDETQVFDTLVSTKEAFDKGFIKPLAQSWHKRLI